MEDQATIPKLIERYTARCFVQGCKEPVVRTIWTQEPQPFKRKDEIVSSCRSHAQWLTPCALPPGLRPKVQERS